MHKSHSPNNNKTWRVAQWAAGRIGRSAMRAVIRHPNLELVGLYVHSEDKEGRDAGELCGLQPVGVKATRSIDELISSKPDCVLYMQEGYNIEDLERLLSAGINIITTRNEFFCPEGMDPELRQRVEQACQEGSASMFATGSSPGFSTAVLPFALSYISRRIDCITIDEFANISASTTPDMITKVMGFGQPAPTEFDRHRLDHVAVGFSQSLQVMTTALRMPIDGFSSVGEFALATKAFEIPGGYVIQPGTVAAQRITIAAVREQKPVAQFRANWYCSRDLDQDWELSENGWRVQIDGDTPMDVNINFPRSTDSFADQMSGLTAHPSVNAIAYVCEAEPGIRTNADLPMIIPVLS